MRGKYRPTLIRRFWSLGLMASLLLGAAAYSWAEGAQPTRKQAAMASARAADAARKGFAAARNARDAAQRAKEAGARGLAAGDAARKLPSHVRERFEGRDGARSSGQRNGYVTMLVPDGTLYEGQSRNFTPAGFGVLTLPDGQVLAGNCASDLDEIGYCVLIPKVDAPGFRYSGTFVDAQQHGFGITELVNTGPGDGLVYAGEVRSGRLGLFGMGRVAEMGSNAVFFGEFMDGEPDGFGLLVLDPDAQFAFAAKFRRGSMEYLLKEPVDLAAYKEPAPPNAKSPLVANAQSLLAQLGLYAGTVDGLTGPKTRAAVRDFQRGLGAPETGVVDERLIGQLESFLAVAGKLAEGQVDNDVAGGPTTGSGFFVSKDGWVLTNRHVVDSCVEVQVVTDGKPLPSTRSILSTTSDLALIKAPISPRGIAHFRGGRGVRSGGQVYALGYPLAGILAVELNITGGNVSSLAGMAGDNSVLQHTAPIQPGNSGGPLVDGRGDVVGVVVSKASLELAALTGDIPENIAFAVKASIARDFLDAQGIDYELRTSSASRAADEIAVDAQKYAVLILCNS